jgi:DNA-binding HxlR family transcriptional regulator
MRSYEQFCGLSKALDVVGGRWTLLIVRELLLGARRYSDLRAALPGIANNLLADRLRELEADGLVARRTLEHGAQVYELTARGQELDQVVFALMRWGAALMEPAPEDFFRPAWLALVLRAYLPGRVARQDRVRARVLVGEAVLTVEAGEQGVAVAVGDGDGAAVTVEADPHALLAVASGAERFAAARRRGGLRVRGPKEDAAKVERLFAAVEPR